MGIRLENGIHVVQHTGHDIVCETRDWHPGRHGAHGRPIVECQAPMASLEGVIHDHGPHDIVARHAKAVHDDAHASFTSLPIQDFIGVTCQHCDFQHLTCPACTNHACVIIICHVERPAKYPARVFPFIIVRSVSRGVSEGAGVRGVYRGVSRGDLIIEGAGAPATSRGWWMPQAGHPEWQLAGPRR